jgi:regulator of protease activity HflC (stomatin/prohibitin superfamily)
MTLNLGELSFFLICALIGLAIVILLSLLRILRVIPEYERGVVFTLEKFSGVRNPGLNIIFPIIQRLIRVDMRLATAEVPRQEVMTKDNIPMLVNAVVYFKVIDPEAVIIKIEDYIFAIRQYTQAALRDVIGNNEMDTVLMERLQIAEAIREIVDMETSDWGVDIESIKIQEMELPAEMKRAMARQAEAERERRATIIASQGELEASKNLRQAAEELAVSPGALHLRTLQTVRDISSDPSEKIVLFLPADLANQASAYIKTNEA